MLRMVKGDQWQCFDKDIFDKWLKMSFFFTFIYKLRVFTSMLVKRCDSKHSMTVLRLCLHWRWFNFVISQSFDTLHENTTVKSDVLKWSRW